MQLEAVVYSFRFRAALLIAGLVMLASLLLAGALGKLLSDRLARDQGDRLEVIARNTASMFAEGLLERLNEVELLTASDDFRRRAFEPAHSNRLIERLHASRPHLQWMGIADTRGHVKVATRDLLLGVDVSQRPWFQRGLSNAVAEDVHEAKLLARLLPAAADGRPQRFVDFAAPIRDDNDQVQGVLGVHLSWDWAREVAGRMLPREAASAGIGLYVLNRAGEIIYPSEGAEQTTPALAGETPRILDWPGQGRFLTAMARLPANRPVLDLGWRIVVRQPADVALAAADAAGRAAIFAGAISAFAFALLAWWVAGHLTAPLDNIASVARRIQAGDMTLEIPRSGHSVELTHLEEALAAMTHSLQAQRQALQEANMGLEDKVRERTEALTVANQELDRLARQDGLTGLNNRRVADLRLGEEAARFRRSARPASVLLADVDHFKRVNDQYGHAVGDRALQYVAHCLQAAVRSQDLVARFGGEEFLLMLPDTDINGALELAERLRAAVAAHPPAPLQVLTLSFGVAPLEGDVEECLRQADAALYTAKQHGRDRAVASCDLG